MNIAQIRSAFLVSLSLHSSFVLVFFVFWVIQKTQPRLAKPTVFEVIVNPQQIPYTIKPERNSAPPQETPQAGRKVFGLQKKTLLSDSTSAETVDVKRGNTLAVQQDNLKMTDDDVESLPIPVDDFLVSEMPKLVAEFRIPYPETAKKASVQGPVIMDILIDQQGLVREVKVVSGPGFGLNEAAAEAVKNFKFSPARVENNPVAVRIRYTYRFILEGS